MEPQEKLILRAKLIASGAIRYWTYTKSHEVHDWLAIVAEELSKIKDGSIVVEIQENLRTYGLHIPKWDTLASLEAEDETKDDVDACKTADVECKPSLYNRRTNNQISEYTEASIRELLGRGLTKSAVARALRVNRRVVIRVAREAQSAQQK